MGLIEKITPKALVLKTDALNEGLRFELRMEGLMPSSSATKHQREYAARSSRELLVAIAASLEQNHQAPSPRTLKNIYYRLRTLLQWMWGQEIWRFGLLSADDLRRFLEYVWDRNEGPVSDKTLAGYVRLLKMMWEVRDEYVSPLRVSPYLLPEIENFSKRGPTVNRWRPIEESRAVALLNAAIEWLDTTTHLLVGLFEQLRAVDRCLVGKTKRERKLAMAEKYSAIADSDLFVQLCEIFGNRQHPSVVIRACWRRSVGATMLIILLFTGLRGSELLSLRRGCVRKEKHQSGRLYDYISGIAAKKNSVPRKWVAPRPVVEAIDKLTCIGEAQLASSTEYLFYNFNGNGCLPVRTARIRRVMDTDVATVCVRSFIESCADIGQGLKRPFHLHQARKTFARFVAIRDKRSLGPLAAHYGHTSVLVTDSRYIGSDIELHQLIDEASREDLADGLLDLISSPSLGGGGGEKVEKLRTYVAQQFRGRVVTKKIVDDLISKGAVLKPCDWGYCLYAKDTSACLGDSAGPSSERRTPSVCGGCKNFAVTEKHRAWWEDRHRRESEFLKSKSLSMQAINICRKRIEETEGLLRSLNRKRQEITKG